MSNNQLARPTRVMSSVPTQLRASTALMAALLLSAAVPLCRVSSCLVTAATWLCDCAAADSPASTAAGSVPSLLLARAAAVKPGALASEVMDGVAGVSALCSEHDEDDNANTTIGPGLPLPSLPPPGSARAGGVTRSMASSRSRPLGSPVPPPSARISRLNALLTASPSASFRLGRCAPSRAGPMPSLAGLPDVCPDSAASLSSAVRPLSAVWLRKSRFGRNASSASGCGRPLSTDTAASARVGACLLCCGAVAGAGAWESAAGAGATLSAMCAFPRASMSSTERPAGAAALAPTLLPCTYTSELLAAIMRMEHTL